MKHVISFFNDIKMYPPIISVIKALRNRGDDVIVIGYCSSDEIKKNWAANGVLYKEVIQDNVKSNAVFKLFKLFKYKIKTQRIIKEVNNDNQALIWIYGARNAWLLHGLFDKYKCLFYLFEMPEFNIPFRFKLLSPLVDYFSLANKAAGVICCEYNRAKITQSYFGLKKEPYVFKNKPNIDICLEQIPDLEKINEKLARIISGKKVVLYQGIFNYPERKLSELCEAINLLPQEYIIVLVGDRGVSGDVLKLKYESERVVFVDFMTFPNYLSLTKRAYIGFLTYNSKPMDLYQTLNTLYCAPNKIFEYSMCDLPVISNDLPAMREIFDKYKFGVAVNELSPNKIAKAIIEISKDYNSFRIECSGFVNSFDLDSSLNNMIESIKCDQ